MVVMTILLISVTAFQVQKLSFSGLSTPDRETLDAVERLTRPAVSKELGDKASPAQLRVRQALDEGIRAAAIVAALMLTIGLLAAARLPAQPAQVLNKG